MQKCCHHLLPAPTTCVQTVYKKKWQKSSIKTWKKACTVYNCAIIFVFYLFDPTPSCSDFFLSFKKGNTPSIWQSSNSVWINKCFSVWMLAHFNTPDTRLLLSTHWTEDFLLFLVFKLRITLHVRFYSFFFILK